MTYRDLLLSEEWRDKRNEILKRDEFKCQSCRNKSLLINNNFSPFLFRKTATNELFKVLVFPLDTGKIISGFLDILSNPELDSHICNKVRNRTLLSFSVEGNSANIEALFELPFELKSTHECLIIEYSELLSSKIQKSRTLSKERVISEIIHRIDKIKWHYVKGLHVHHKFYKINTLPWDYDDNALLTYCWECHKKLHEEEIINLIDHHGNIITSLTPCERCHGAGWIPKYSHIDCGICFKCYGAKFIELINNEEYL
jgi:hypothetical protein